MQSYKYKRIASGDANTTVTVCATPCVLKSITINTTSAHALTVKDNGSNVDNTVATIAASPVIGSVFEYNVDLEAGLKITVPTGYVGDATIAFLPL